MARALQLLVGTVKQPPGHCLVGGMLEKEGANERKTTPPENTENPLSCLFVNYF
jgi:hypothetical protein